MRRFMILALLSLAALGCRERRDPNVHPGGTFVADNEMFDFIVGKCLEAQVDLYAIHPPSTGGESRIVMKGSLTRPGHNGGPRSPEDFEPNKAVGGGRTLLAHFPPGTRFQVDEIIKKDNPLDSPSYYYVAMLRVPGEEAEVGFDVDALLNTIAFPHNPRPPKERFARGEGHPLHESIRYCNEADDLAVQPRAGSSGGREKGDG